MYLQPVKNYDYIIDGILTLINGGDTKAKIGGLKAVEALSKVIHDNLKTNFVNKLISVVK